MQPSGWWLINKEENTMRDDFYVVKSKTVVLYGFVVIEI